MNMRATLDPYNSYCGPGHNAALVDKAFGSAYDVVRSVAEGMSFVKHVSYHMEDIFEMNKIAGAISVLAGVANDITGLNAVRTQMVAVHGIIPQIVNVSARTTQVVLVADNMPKLLKLHAELPMFTVLHSNLPQLVAVHAQLAVLADIHAVLTKLEAVHAELVTLNLVADELPAITTVAAAVADVIAVSTDIGNVNAVAAKIVELQAIFDALPTLALFSDDEKVKLGGIEEGATANSADLVLLDRTNHTGTQEATSVMVTGDLLNGVVDSDLQAAFMALAARVQALEDAAP